MHIAIRQLAVNRTPVMFYETIQLIFANFDAEL